VSPREFAISEGDRAAITARVEVLGHGGGPLMRQASGAPDADGIVVVHRGREVIGSADVDPATGEAKLRIDDLPVGSRSLRIEFLPDGYGVAPAETAVAYTVAAAAVDPRPVDPGDD